MPRQWDSSLAEQIITAHAGAEGPMLPILNDIQETFGLIPDDAIRLIATKLNLTRAEVHGVVSFYHDYRKSAHGRHVLKLCRAEACQAMGGAAYAEALLARLGLDWGETTADGRLTIEPVYCLGLCACAPSAMLDGELHARLDGPTLSALLQELA